LKVAKEVKNWIPGEGYGTAFLRNVDSYPSHMKHKIGDEVIFDDVPPAWL
jgi:hypothetical protein